MSAGARDSEAAGLRDYEATGLRDYEAAGLRGYETTRLRDDRKAVSEKLRKLFFHFPLSTSQLPPLTM